MRNLFLAAVATLVALALPASSRADRPGDTTAPCRGIVRIYMAPDGTVRRMRLVCDGQCPDGDHCQRGRTGNHHGGLRQWCSCDTRSGEPQECHVVLYTPGAGEGGGDPQVLCAGPCIADPTAECLQVIVNEYPLRNGGLVQDVTCECL